MLPVPPPAVLDGPLPWAVLAGATIVMLALDSHFFARGRVPEFREGVIWSIGWLVVSLLAAVVLLVLVSADSAITYTTVYFIERSLSLDNLFVFLLLFTYFSVPQGPRANLLFWGIGFALVLRGLAILGGVALIEQFHFVIYVLGVLLLVLAYRILKGVEDNVNPERNLVVRGVRRVFPVTTDFHGTHWFVVEDGKRHATPLFLCLAAIVAADIAFAVDSIPAAFAITRESALIWIGNIFAPARPAGAVRPRREPRAALPLPRRDDRGRTRHRRGQAADEDIYKIGAWPRSRSSRITFTVGIAASLLADRRDPHSEERARRARRAPARSRARRRRRPSVVLVVDVRVVGIELVLLVLGSSSSKPSWSSRPCTGRERPGSARAARRGGARRRARRRDEHPLARWVVSLGSSSATAAVSSTTIDAPPSRG